MKKAKFFVVCTLIVLMCVPAVFAEGYKERSAAYEAAVAAEMEVINSQKGKIDAYDALIAQQELEKKSAFAKFPKSSMNLATPTGSSRPYMVGRSIVESGDPQATAAGMRILQEGGTAFDAALAMAGVQSLIEFTMTNILGGDTEIIIYNAAQDKVSVYNGTGWDPEKGTIDFYMDEGGIPSEGPKSIQIPGAWAGWMMMLKENGTLPLRQILAPVLEYCDEGYYCDSSSSVLSYYAQKKVDTLSDSFKNLYFNGDKVKGMDDLIINTDFGNTLRELCDAAESEETLSAGFEAASDYYYRGPIAQKIVDWSEKNGGIFTLADFNDFYAEKQEPMTTNYRGYDVFVCPPNSQGPVILEALNILENFDLSSYSPNNAEYIDLLVQSLNVALNDRNMFYGDQRFVDVPEYLFSKEYAKDVAQNVINPGTPMRKLPDGSQWIDYNSKGSDTTYMYVADKYGNIVSCTHSICNVAGSFCVPDGTGIVMNNRMTYFNLYPDSPNCVEPHKRTMQTITPIIGFKDGKPAFIAGTPGADAQAQEITQLIIDIVDFGYTNPQHAIELPRVNTKHPAGLMNQNEFPTRITCEVGHSKETVMALEAMGYQVVYGRGMGNGLAIIDENNVKRGAADPRGTCYSLGW